jgi:hypothetical protein
LPIGAPDTISASYRWCRSTSDGIHVAGTGDGKLPHGTGGISKVLLEKENMKLENYDTPEKNGAPTWERISTGVGKVCM